MGPILEAIRLQDLEIKKDFTKEKFHALREQLYNLRACGVIESEKVYLFRIQELIDQEAEALNNLK